MKIIILGAGKVGATLTEDFSKEGYDVVVIDKNQKTIEDIVNSLDVNGIVGNGLERSALIEAGANYADYFISCTSMDEVNILSCVLAKNLGVKKTIARVRDPLYFSEMNNLSEHLGLDFAFNPERRTAIDIAQLLKFPSAKNVESFAGGRAMLVELEVAEGNPIIGKSLKDVSSVQGYNVLFGMVSRKNDYFIPNGDFVIALGDKIYIIAEEKEIDAFCKKLMIYKRPIKSVFIIGGGKIAYYLAKHLSASKIAVKVLEKDSKRCAELSEELVSVNVLCGDGTDQKILNEERIKNSNAVVTLTGVDEENIVVSLYAKQQQIDKVITKVDRPEIADMVNSLGLESVVSPRTSIANHILSFVRAHVAENGNGVNTLYKLNDKIEALEFTVPKDFKANDKKIKEVKFKSKLLIGGIVRGNQYILPNGDTEIKANDRIIVVTETKQISDISEILR